MRRLISADMARLLRWGPFRLGGAFMAVYGLCNLLLHFALGDRQGAGAVMDFVVTMMYVQAIIAVSFLNGDHSSGGIKNKLIIGRTRGEVYISHLLVQYLCGLILAALYLLPSLILWPLLAAPGAPELPAGLCCYPAVLLSFTAIYTLLGLLVPRRWVTTAGFAGSFMLMCICTRMDEGLAIPETAPAYVKEPLRGVYCLFLDVSPAGEAMQLMDTGFRQSELWVLAVSGLGVAFIAVILGMIGFLRMDIE